jgi:hypothetical protein
MAAAVAGCGGGDDSEGPGAKADWVEQANGVCRDAAEKAAKLPDDLGLSADAGARRAEREIVQARLEGLRELEQRSRRAFDDFLAAAKSASTGAGAEPAEEREKSVRLLGEQKRLGEQAAAIAREIGLSACARA